MRLFRIIASFLLVVVLMSAVVGATELNVGNSGAVTRTVGHWFDYVLVIVLENHDLNWTYYNGGPTNDCLGNCTYFTNLANANGLAEAYTLDGITGCSAGCYIALTSGYGNTASACNSGPATCSFSFANIIDRLEAAQLTWKAYMENYPTASGCDTSSTGTYTTNHNPFIYYTDITSNPARCARIVSANTQKVAQSACYGQPLTTVQNDDVLFRNLNSPSNASNYMFLTPNTVDDAHDCVDVSMANAWLSNTIPQILSSVLFETKRAALFITFDEPYLTSSLCGSSCPKSIPQLYTVWSSPSVVKPGFKSVVSYTHYSALRTIEDNWGLPPFYAATDGTANSMTEFFL